MDIKLIFSILGVATIFIGEVVYIKEILKERTKPHPFTWLGWSLLTGLVAKPQKFGVITVWKIIKLTEK